GSVDLLMAISASGSFDVASGATLVINNVISGTPTTLTKSSGGTVVLGGVNTLGTGASPTAYTISSGVLSIGASSGLGTDPTTAGTGNVTINGGTLRSAASGAVTFIN